MTALRFDSCPPCQRVSTSRSPQARAQLHQRAVRSALCVRTVSAPDAFNDDGKPVSRRRCSTNGTRAIRFALVLRKSCRDVAVVTRDEQGAPSPRTDWTPHRRAECGQSVVRRAFDRSESWTAGEESILGERSWKRSPKQSERKKPPVASGAHAACGSPACHRSRNGAYCSNFTKRSTTRISSLKSAS